jgi:hypothetical protein
LNFASGPQNRLDKSLGAGGEISHCNIGPRSGRISLDVTRAPGLILTSNQPTPTFIPAVRVEMTMTHNIGDLFQ